MYTLLQRCACSMPVAVRRGFTGLAVHRTQALLASIGSHLQLASELRTQSDTTEAFALFDAARASEAVDRPHLKAILSLCDNSTEQRRLIQEMAVAGMRPNAAMYAVVVKQLMMEGHDKEARAVVESDMPAAGVGPNKPTRAVLAVSEKTLSQIRTRHLQKLLHKRTPKAQEQAQAFFERLESAGVANAFHRSKMRLHRLQGLLMEGTPKATEQAQALFEEIKVVEDVFGYFHWGLMQQLCNSTEQRSMMEEMAEAGVQPNAVNYNVLTKQLILEGQNKAARAVVESEMPAAGVVPNNHTHALFETLENSRKLASEASELLQKARQKARQGDITGTRKMFDAARASGVADLRHWSVMLRLCDNSTEQRSMIEEMAEAGVQPNAVTYKVLIKQLILEGQNKEARAVVESDMPAAGVVPIDREGGVHEVLEKSEEQWSKKRARHLQKLLDKGTPETQEQAQAFFERLESTGVANAFHRSKMRFHRLQGLLMEGTPKATEQAQALFEEFKASGTADVFHWSVMQQLCNSTEQRSMMEEMVEAGVQPNFITYNVLIKQLMLEGQNEEARAVVESEMPAAGVVPTEGRGMGNERAHALLETSEGEWSELRIQRLQVFLQTGCHRHPQNKGGGKGKLQFI